METKQKQGKARKSKDRDETDMRTIGKIAVAGRCGLAGTNI